MVVVITRASAGVGRAAVRAFARNGADIGLLARGIHGLAAAEREVEAEGRRALAVPTDVADAGDVEQAAARIERELGPIDVWVNNAMVSVFSPVSELTPEEVRRVTEVTYLGVVYGTMAALKRMLPRDHGSIVQVGSALAYRGIPLQAAYCGAKHAVQGFTESLRCELLHDRSRVHVSMVHLPAMNTPQFDWVRSRLPRRPQPVPPIYQPEVAAEAIIWAAAHRRREISVGAPTVAAIWGNKLRTAAARTNGHQRDDARLRVLRDGRQLRVRGAALRRVDSGGRAGTSSGGACGCARYDYRRRRVQLPRAGGAVHEAPGRAARGGAVGRASSLRPVRRRS